MSDRQKFDSTETWAVKAYTILMALSELDPSPEVVKEAANTLISEAPAELTMVGSLAMLSLIGEFESKFGKDKGVAL